MPTGVANYEVFICYETTTGLDLASHLKDALEKAKISAFVAKRDIPPGQADKPVINRAIDGCTYCCVILTVASPDSPEVKREIRKAERQSKHIIPCRDCRDGNTLPQYYGQLFARKGLQQLAFGTKEHLAAQVLLEIRGDKGTLSFSSYVDDLAPAAARQPIPTRKPQGQELGLLLQRGKTRQATSAAKLLIGQGESEAKVGHSLLTRVLLIRGDKHFHKGDFSRAERCYRQAQDHARLAKERSLLTICQYELGAASGQLGHHDEALRLFSRVIRANPNLAPAYYNRGLAYSRRKDFDAAIRDYDRAIALDPNYAQAYNNRGNAYYHRQNYDRAIQDYDRAIALDPNYAHAMANLGFTFLLKKDTEKAMLWLAKALEHRESLPDNGESILQFLHSLGEPPNP